jgi:hypothetical protein
VEPTPNQTIREYLGLNAVKPYNNNKALPLQCADPSLLMGLELEIENVPNWEEMVISGMTSVEDGSLRNSGREFLTSPATFSVVHHTLERFFEKNKLGPDNYSERTSVHVHANCQDLTKEQVAAVCLLYQVFEKLFYAFVGEERDKNIFCIPWDQTLITYSTIDAVLGAKGIHALKNWQKYTGLNLLPLFGLGTVEFRHMAGTNDLEKIGIWLNLIGSLFAYARKHPINDIKDTLINLNSTSAYEDTTHRVFTFWTKHLINVPGYRPFLEEGVLNMKYSLLKHTSAYSDGIEQLLRQQRELERIQQGEAVLAQIERNQIRARVEAETTAVAGNAAMQGANIWNMDWPTPRFEARANVGPGPVAPGDRGTLRAEATSAGRRRPAIDPFGARAVAVPPTAPAPEIFFDESEDNE